MAGDLSVPVLRLPVQLLLDNGNRRDVTVFVPSGETLEDFCASTALFIPAREGDQIRLYARQTLACLSVTTADLAQLQAERDDSDMPLCRRQIEVAIVAGNLMRGELRYIPDHESVRTIDYLNSASLILPVFAEGIVHYVWKAHIESVLEV